MNNLAVNGTLTIGGDVSYDSLDLDGDLTVGGVSNLQAVNATTGTFSGNVTAPNLITINQVYPVGTILQAIGAPVFGTWVKVGLFGDLLNMFANGSVFNLSYEGTTANFSLLIKIISVSGLINYTLNLDQYGLTGRVAPNIPVAYTVNLVAQDNSGSYAGPRDGETYKFGNDPDDFILNASGIPNNVYVLISAVMLVVDYNTNPPGQWSDDKSYQWMRTT
jgi:hypothetical protein